MTRWFFPRVPLTQNQRERVGWRALSSNKKRWSELVGLIAKHNPNPPPERVLLTITIKRPRRQDPGNREGSVKPLVDAINQHGWLVDDDDKHLELIVHEVSGGTKSKHGAYVDWEPLL